MTSDVHWNLSQELDKAVAATVIGPMPSPDALQSDTSLFERDGAQLFRSALGETALQSLEMCLADLPSDQAGIRLHGIEPLRPLLASTGPVGAVAASILGGNCRAVRAILFDKTIAANWSLAWHQDRTIAVTERREVAGYGPWTVKSGWNHVAPPFELLAGMVTLRVHIDPVSAANAPLLVVPGSHLLGRILEPEISAIVQRHGSAVCLAEAGDVWLYATPILHASEAASEPARRRVLQVDYAAGDLPGGLQWLGV